MVYTKFVEIGRVAVVNYGPKEGSIGAIINVIDNNTVLMEGPAFKRQVVNLKRVSLTDIVLDISLQATTKNINKAWKASDVDSKYAESAEGKTAAIRAKRASMNDFERFKVRIAKKQRAKAFKAELKKLRAK
mmetsp:Transcript_25455/g.55684  ORF Transcript_25455/g.55684 Transcript_25455/m.55684 type:complete len:132 (+) Transcript_25455:82-477(+)